jgi:hypothetical protein
VDIKQKVIIADGDTAKIDTGGKNSTLSGQIIKVQIVVELQVVF